ncbi:hypothetical protein [Nocardioides currus]|uniref:Uridine kinase n=1 Tax=Nocardioides currus TaxID=2133958 RepID=A0A2R7Z161_9ACTN|nr:hypothetical protein [Nocardioides currus]PUA82371.1 hypothetical protein C7S10_01050 [Nocardioides currus]
MPTSTYDDLLARVRALVTDLARPPVVAIAGHGGAGKSTLALRLAADLGVTEDQVVGTDGLYARTDTERAAMWDLHDWPALVDLLTRVRAEPTPERLAYRYRWYDGSEGDVDEPMPPVVVVEGIRVVRPELMHLVDLAVWIDLDPVAAAVRAKARNLAQGDSEDELALWDTKWVPEGIEYQRLVRPEELADVVVRSEG